MDLRDRRPLRGAVGVVLVASAFLASCTSGETLSGVEPVEVRVCPEGIRISERGNPIGLVSGHIRQCWPGEAYCFCDRDDDCYAESGYVPCTPPSPDAGAADVVADAAVTDTATVDAGAPDVAAIDATPDVSVTDAATVDAPVDTGSVDAGNVCPEATRISAAGNVVGVISGHIRQCWPGEARCFCDRDNDCYAESGYVPCTPPGTSTGTTDSGVSDASVTDSAVADVAVDTGGVADVGAVDAGALSPDPVSYSGSFAGGTGYYLARLTVAGEGRDVWVYAPASRSGNPPLVVAFHGTNADGDVMINDSGLRAVADAQGVVVVAPTSRWFGGEGGDYDHPGGNGTYWETRNTNANTNPDLLLARAAMVEAHRRYNTDFDRVYSVGHSNGGFMSLLVSVALRDRIAAFAENSAGMVTCSSRPACYFEGSSLTCAGLAGASGWCGCSGPGLPIDLPATGHMPPGYLSHGAQDPIVSVFYTCALASRMSALGVPVEVSLHNGGHDLSVNFARNAWPFLSRFRRQ